MGQVLVKDCLQETQETFWMRSQKEKCKEPIVAAMVHGKEVFLHEPVPEHTEWSFIPLSANAGVEIYRRSLLLLLITAVHELYRHVDIVISHSLSTGIYCELYQSQGDHALVNPDIDGLKKKMAEIVAENRKIRKHTCSRKEAIAIYDKIGRQDKTTLLRQQNYPEYVNIYYCGESFAHLNGPIVPETGILTIYDLQSYDMGLIICFPEAQDITKVGRLTKLPQLAKVFHEAGQWAKIMHCDYTSDLNGIIQTGQIQTLIRVAEALHEKKVAQIADMICERKEKVRAIFIAGPSSSGKTTFAHRLSIQLRVNGLRPVPICLDDYFVNREESPRDANGNYDFESIYAIDLKLFNQQLQEMLAGREVKLPRYNFHTGLREYKGDVVQLDPSQPLIIEGIHGLNERLSSSVPKQRKFKVYISALTQLSLDLHNRIPTTDTRLIRRMVRDNKYRSHNATRTLHMWPSVRRGEESNIFPYQEEADVMFNSALIYELSVLKKYAVPLLQTVSEEDPVYPEARRLLHFLSYFYSISDEDIPANSLMREFIGGSCFH